MLYMVIIMNQLMAFFLIRFIWLSVNSLCWCNLQFISIFDDLLLLFYFVSSRIHILKTTHLG